MTDARNLQDSSYGGLILNAFWVKISTTKKMEHIGK